MPVVKTGRYTSGDWIIARLDHYIIEQSSDSIVAAVFFYYKIQPIVLIVSALLMAIADKVYIQF